MKEPRITFVKLLIETQYDNDDGKLMDRKHQEVGVLEADIPDPVSE